MFVTLLIVTFAVAAASSTVAALVFSRPVSKLFGRIVAEELASVWKRYIFFALYVVGISGGVRLFSLERYVTPDKDGQFLKLTSDRWVIEIYETVLGSLQAVAWMLLIVFLFALIAYVVLRGHEMKRKEPDEPKEKRMAA